MRRALVFAFLCTTAAALPALAGSSKTAFFAGGCYWSIEHDMRPIKGVTSVTSGYMTYPTDFPPDAGVRGVRRFESVRVTYDPDKISYADLVAKYVRLIDPTDAGGQFCDRGPGYRTAIFVTEPGEQATAQAALDAAQAQLKHPIATKVLQRTRFEQAPPDQQDWAHKNPVRYADYRQGCGKDRALKLIWGG
jgi:peptide-methionine (S)-S-oxide reductase